MDRKHSSNLYYFVAVLFFLTAWWVVSMSEGGEGIWIILSTLIAFTGFGIALEGIRTAVREPSPFAGRTGKILWMLRPRAWLVAWGVIMIFASLYGTPHFAWNYPPRLPQGQCEYVGLNGIKRVPAISGSLLNGCALVRVL